MKNHLLFPLLWLVGSSCASTSAPTEGSHRPTAETSVQRLTGSIEPGAAAPASASKGEDPAAAAEGAPARGPGRRLGASELSLWNDSNFQLRFTESYLAETEIEPRLTTSEREQMQKVLEHIASDRVDRALNRLLKQRGPASSAVLDFTLGNIHFQHDDLDAAAADYAAAVAKFPKFRRAWKNLALIHVRQGSFELAQQALTRVIELGGGDGITYGLLGFAYASSGHELSAETAYRMAVLLDPSTLDWKMGLARSLFKQRRFADAAALCDALLQASPERADLWLLQANAFIGMNEPLRAAQNFELAEQLGGSTVESSSTLGDIYVNQELFDLGVAAYLRGIERDPEASSARALRAARVMTAHGALEETRRLLEGIEAVRDGRMSPQERRNLLELRARLAVAEGQDAEGARVLEELVSLDPLDGEALLLLGQYLGRAGESERAILYLERAANLEAFEADARVRHAQILVEAGRLAEALPLLRRAQTLKPRDNVQSFLDKVEHLARGR